MSEPIFRDIVIKDQALFNTVLEEHKPEISEYTFSNLFIWRLSKKTRLAEFDDGLVITVKDKGNQVFMPPIGVKDINGTCRFLLDNAQKFGCVPRIIRMGDIDTNKLDHTGLSVSEDRDNFDYVYLSDDLASLKGRRYDGKRGFVAKFQDICDWKFEDYEPGMKNDCFHLASEWVRKRGNDEGVMMELDAIKEYMDNWETFGCCGAVLKVDDHIAGFTFGERLNHDTMVVHFEKCDTECPGAYQAINQMFAKKTAGSGLKYLNREQDLGLEGIRKAKLSYHPVKMIRKYSVVRAE